MKKFFVLTILANLILFCSCTDCANKNVKFSTDTTLVAQQDNNLNVEHIIAMDRQAMYVNHGDNYRWFECCMKLNNFLDEENDGSLVEVVNVFQSVVDYDDKTFDVTVHKFQHFADGTYANDSVDGFWIEDQPMNDDSIKITFREAYDNLMATNMPKPHSRYVTLRKQVGPLDANPQYIFGNLREVVFVDAVTGEVRDYNPAFEKGFKMPLGEWP